MRKWLILGILMMFLLSCTEASAAVRTSMTIQADMGNQLVTFSAEPETEADAEAAERIQGIVDERFFQSEALRAFARVLGRGPEGTIFEKGFLYQGEHLTSACLVWNGEQSGRGRGSTAMSLCFNPDTGEEIALDDLFIDAGTAKGRLEEIIQLDILDSLSDYLEASQLLPIPEDTFFCDAYGLTIYYPEDQYHLFSGECGAVHFAWYEIADLLNTEVIVLPEKEVSGSGILSALAQGTFGEVFPLSLGEPLDRAAQQYPGIMDPDYTETTKLYPFEEANLRGFAVEIPKYADTDDLDTPMCAVRSSRISLYGLTTGWTGTEEIVDLLGEPVSRIQYNEDKADYNMLSPGESLIYPAGAYYLEVHLDEEGLLSALILRDSMPK